MKDERPILGITMGDPAGIGPEISVKALKKDEIYKICRPLIIGDAKIIKQGIGIVQADLKVNAISEVQQARFENGIIDVLDLNNVDMERLTLGKVSKMAGKAAFEYIEKVIDLALKKEIDATITNPINKEALNTAGYRYSGHTQIYAELTKTNDYAMLLADENLKVVHVSTHVSLREACDIVKKERILKVIRLAHNACQRMGINNPKIGVAGLNPHASENGMFGWEEEKEILPAVKQSIALGFNVEGPIPADTLFSKARGGMYDIVIAMYHDQGHIPLKIVGFNWDEKNHKMNSVKGVNITLGLPIIRSSVDHGTAYDMAGKGIACAASLIHAIEYGAKLSELGHF